MHETSGKHTYLAISLYRGGRVFHSTAKAILGYIEKQLLPF